MRPGRAPALGRSCQIYSRCCPFVCRLAQLYVISSNTSDATFSPSVIRCIVSGPNTNLEFALGLIMRLALRLNWGLGFSSGQGRRCKVQPCKAAPAFSGIGGDVSYLSALQRKVQALLCADREARNKAFRFCAGHP